LDENLGALANTGFTDEELARIDAITGRESTIDLWNVSARID
jgi:L-glyceraldehyde 3-phosphate reductase